LIRLRIWRKKERPTAMVLQEGEERCGSSSEATPFRASKELASQASATMVSWRCMLVTQKCHRNTLYGARTHSPTSR
jgi:hypothetical protein